MGGEWLHSECTGSELLRTVTYGTLAMETWKQHAWWYLAMLHNVVKDGGPAVMPRSPHQLVAVRLGRPGRTEDDGCLGRRRLPSVRRALERCCQRGRGRTLQRGSLLRSLATGRWRWGLG